MHSQELTKRALVIAAAGAHNLLMLGPPGSGKTEDIPRHPALDPAARFAGHSIQTRESFFPFYRSSLLTAKSGVPPNSRFTS